MRLLESKAWWGCFSLGQIHQIEGTLNAEKYKEILRSQMLPHYDKMELEYFQEDNDPKHRGPRGAKIVKNDLKKPKQEFLELTGHQILLI